MGTWGQRCEPVRGEDETVFGRQFGEIVKTLILGSD